MKIEELEGKMIAILGTLDDREMALARAAVSEVEGARRRCGGRGVGAPARVSLRAWDDGAVQDLSLR